MITQEQKKGNDKTKLGTLYLHISYSKGDSSVQSTQILTQSLNQ